MKILIINSVPYNIGDEIILRSTIFILKVIYPNSEIKVLTNNLLWSNYAINDLSYDLDYEYVCNTKINIIYQYSRRVLNYFGVKYHSRFSLFFASDYEKKITTELFEASLIILSGGSYFIQNYSNNLRVRTLKMLIEKGKKIIFFPQSIGPINNKTFFNLIEKVDLIFIRELISYNYVKERIKTNNLILTNDISLIYANFYENLPNKNNGIKNIIINFRKWDNFVDIEKFTNFCNFIIVKYDVNITYISTCQGINGYTNDSEIGLLIEKNIKYKKKFKVLLKKYELFEFIKIIKENDAYFGMRLHGALISLISGLPSFVINYEHKSLGIFESLSLQNYAVNFDDSIDKWIDKFDFFYNNFNFLKMQIPQIINKEQEKLYNSIKLHVSNIVK